MQVSCSSLFKHFEDVGEDGLHSVEADVREDRFLQLDATDLEPVLVIALELLARVS